MQQEAAIFSRLFRGLCRSFTTVKLLDEYEELEKGGRKRLAEVRWKHKLVKIEQYAQHLTGTNGLGITPVNDEGTCYFGVIDIDEYIWSENRLKNLLNRIGQLQLPLVAGRSKSGGVRLYAFCEESPANIMIQFLKTCAVTLGFGKAEIFPKTANLVAERKDVGHAITLPYFGEDGHAFSLEGPLTLQEFIKLALSKLCKTSDLRKVPGVQLENVAEFSDGPPCLQSLSINGFPEGGRKNALFNIGVYLRLKHADTGPARFLDEYNRKFMRPALDSKEVQDLLKQLPKKDYWYKCKAEPICSACNKDLCLTRKYGIGSGSGESNIKIGAMTKYTTNPPVWLVEINNRSIEMETENFVNMQSFIKICIEQLHIVPNISTIKLRHMLNEALAPGRLQTIEAPSDASLDGQCLNLLHQFLQSKPPGAVKDDLVFGAPWYEDGYVHFRGKDFTDYLDMENFRKLDSRRISLILRRFSIDKGGDGKCSVAFRINERVIKCRRIKYDKPIFAQQEIEQSF